MRKVLVVLLVLSVLGGVFAQEGSWSISAQADIGSVIDFFNGGEEGASVYAANRLQCCCDTPPDGRLGLTYSRGGLSYGINFNTAQWGRWSEDPASIGVFMNYWGDRYAFAADAKLSDLISGAINGVFYKGAPDLDADPPETWSRHQGALWGYYQMLNGMFHLEAAVNGRWQEWWYSNGAVFDLFGGAAYNYRIPEDPFANLDRLNSAVLMNLNFSGLQFGIILPNTFEGGFSGGAGWGLGIPFEAQDLIDDVLLQSVIGIKFNMHPFEIAAQFRIEDFNAYLGLKWFLNNLTAGLSFFGNFDDNDVQAAIAISADYTPGIFGAGLSAGYALDTSDQDGWRVGVAPYFWYNVLPNNMQFKLDAKIMFGKGTFSYEFKPAMLWNFKGTGAGNWDTGIGVGYTFAGDSTNNVTANQANVVFRWSL